MKHVALSESHWPADTSQTLMECTLSDLLRTVASECPEQMALIDIEQGVVRNSTWTYQEMLVEVELRAQALMQILPPGSTVGIYAPNSADWIILQHAIAMAGLILVPINPAYEKAELAGIIMDADLSAIFHADVYRGRDLGAVVDEATTGQQNPCRKFSLASWRDELGSGNPDKSFPDVASSSTLLIQFTSGTTGRPKGACLHHKGVLNMARFVGQRVAFPHRGVWINAMPLYHVGGSVVTALATLNGRGCYVVAPGFEPGQMLQLIESEKGNCTLVVPTMIHAMLRHPDLPDRDLSSMVTVLTGAAPVPEALAQQVRKDFDCQLSILFGQTELNGVISQTRVDDTLEDQCGTLGQPLPQIEVRIVDPASGKTLPIGETGEIWARGYQVMNAYHGMAEATGETITPDGWLRMGDMGTMDDRGFLRIVGRSKDLIIRGGMNIYPREIEDCLLHHPDVAQVAVLGLPDEHWGEVIGAIIIPKDLKNPPAPEALHAYCRTHIAVHKAPERWFFVQQYPLTPSGKVQKFELAKLIQQGELTAAPWEKKSVASAV